MMQTNSRGLVYSLVGFLVLLVAATLVIHLAYVDPDTHQHLNVLGSIYFTVETVATVGYGDYSFANQSAWLHIFAIVLIILGVTVVSIIFALVHEYLGQSPH